jgi:hypothetical protein
VTFTVVPPEDEGTVSPPLLADELDDDELDVAVFDDDEQPTTASVPTANNPMSERTRI